MVAKSARLLAPIALVAVTVGVYLIVHSTLNPHTRTPARSSSIVNGTRQVVKKRRHHVPRFYVVKPGDTLSSIAQRTGVAMDRLTALNPSLSSSPNSLQTGQRLRLRR